MDEKAEQVLSRTSVDLNIVVQCPPFTKVTPLLCSERDGGFAEG